MCLPVRKFVLEIMRVLVLFQNFSVSELFFQTFVSFNFVKLFLNDILHMSFLAGIHVFKAFPAYTTTEL